MENNYFRLQRTSFCSGEDGQVRPLRETMYDAVIGWIYIFDFLNVKPEPTRLKHLFYYSIVLVENGGLAAAWYVDTDDPSPITNPLRQPVTLVALALCSLFGIAFMLMYYRYFHPEGRLPKPGTVARLV